VRTVPTARCLPPAWHAEALCAQSDPDAWFPDYHPAAAVLRVCAACPVRPECLGQALADREMHGVWGGTTPAQRRQLLTTERAA
jgi:WhiB family transcriptional regulator, redox-sensing transcriptional regulator